MNILNRGDALLARLAKTKHLLPILFGVAFLEATISPILPEALVALVLTYRKDFSWKVLAIVSAVGSSCGALLMYVFGKFFFGTYGVKIIALLHGADVAEKAKELFNANAFTAQFFAALTPLPDRVFSFLAGAFLVAPGTVFLATFLGRLVRVLPVAYLSYEYGDEARMYIKKHTQTTLIFVIACVATYACYQILW